jgi:hypothetical protein
MSRPLWALIRLTFWLSGAATVFGLLLLASLWFVIPFVLALVAATTGWIFIGLRARDGWTLVRSWTRRAL